VHSIAEPWDYVILTASNPRQAEAYRHQLDLRRSFGLLSRVGRWLVVPDPGGKRIGSGASTAYCLMEVLRHELGDAVGHDAGRWTDVLSRLRVLILHAGGDSRRLPAYGPCGKLFVPMPGPSDGALPLTLFDRQLDRYLALPTTAPGRGQVVITAGDVLLLFDPAAVRLDGQGITGLSVHGSTAQAARHGVYCADEAGTVRCYLQKPSLDDQAACGAVNRYGQATIDIGVISFDAATAATLLQLVGAAPTGDGRLTWTGPVAEAIETGGMDFYREICCALGTDATGEHHATWSRASGSHWSDGQLARAFETLAGIPLATQVLPRCALLHFGTTGQIIDSGYDLLRQDRGVAEPTAALRVNTEMAPDAAGGGGDSWIESCRVTADLHLAGRNVVVGADIAAPLALPEGAVLDVMPGQDRNGRPVHFVRCYHTADTFKDAVGQGATFCGMDMARWLAAVGADAADVWDTDLGEDQRSLWTARVFAAADSAAAGGDWVWMYSPAGAAPDDRQRWLDADRYSVAEMAGLADHDAFGARRVGIRAGVVRNSLRRLFRRDSDFSAAELAFVLRCSDQPGALAADVLAEAMWQAGDGAGGMDLLVSARIMHSLATAVERLAGEGAATLEELLPGLGEAITSSVATWLTEIGLDPSGAAASDWARRAKAYVFERQGRTIIDSRQRKGPPPRSALRDDEIVWGRAPARLDFGGGWADTPPYSLECGGCVINAAIDLNGQPPIGVYARVIDEPVIRIASIDVGTRVEIRQLSDLLDYRAVSGEFSMAKAALALSGFSPETADWPADVTLAQMLGHFGGGLELTTLAAIPKGSGLGTSSILGAALVAVVHSVVGADLDRRTLFHAVLKLEQMLTTGGGWQDQIGGVIDGVKVITTGPGMVPEPTLHAAVADVLDPQANGGVSLLYYTGITRLAKNILQQVVGRYLDRNHAALATQREIHAMAPHVARAMARKDLPAFGRLVAAAWEQNKRLDPGSTTPEVDAVLDRIGPHIHGAKLLGAGGGGFMLIICKTPADAAAVREMLDADPPNARARFFDFSISTEGLVVTVS